ncbi:hypothetical protein K040078D81_61210 [Blautia hominis]|uniref:Uncharacterized protein n=1 Tax=Blautia hominis TaxID=2025493 RepID=A0ABQ0BKL6_9FIRM
MEMYAAKTRIKDFKAIREIKRSEQSRAETFRKAVEKESCNDIQGPVIAKGLSK